MGCCSEPDCRAEAERLPAQRTRLWATGSIAARTGSPAKVWLADQPSANAGLFSFFPLNHLCVLFALDFRTKNILHRTHSTFRPFLAEALKALSSQRCPQKYCPVGVSARRAMQCGSASHVGLFSQNLETGPATQLAGLSAVTARAAKQKYNVGDSQN